ncbi:ANTAR domain-containing protein [Solicola sp. PLA-1-18]|uniref:ANTAR domain-containing protein n=1 Tax=Solicola sp. PLA-1-18 TaxID=3380532 RepID=UPI003B7C37A5
MTQPIPHDPDAGDEHDVALSASVRAMLDVVDVRQSIDMVCNQLASACALAAGTSHVGLVVLDARGERVRHRGASSMMASVLDERQLTTSRGPLADVMRNHRAPGTPPPDDETGRQRLPQAAGTCGAIPLRVVPLGPGTGWVALVTLYSEHPIPRTPPDIAKATSAVAATLLDAAIYIHSMHRALETRGQIGLAQGVLMERHSIDEARAMDVLRRLSQHQNVKLSAIARRLVASARFRSSSGTTVSSDPTTAPPHPPLPGPRRTGDAA